MEVLPGFSGTTSNANSRPRFARNDHYNKLLLLLLLLLSLLLSEAADDNAIRAVKQEMRPVKNQYLKEKLDEVKSYISAKKKNTCRKTL